jgi:hypothetical protein
VIDIEYKSSEKEREYRRNYLKKWKLEHPEEAKVINRRCYLKNKETHNKNCTKNLKIWRRKKRREVIDALGGKCIKCGCSDWRCLQIDHINGGGSIELKEFNKKRIQYYKKILELVLTGKNIDYQLLCANCNWIKKFENDEV